MPCTPDDVSVTEPELPHIPGIPGLGSPFTPGSPESLFKLPDGFPENLMDLFQKLSMILPTGTLKPSLSPGFSKNIFDAILSLLDKFFPFLMMYKFFLPILNLIICILEVLCALMNPFKLARAIVKLFRVCIPEFLSLFPIFALILMIISLLLLLLAIIEYIIIQILRIIQLILRNIIAILKAIFRSDIKSILAIVKKLGMLLCGFQNLFVVLAIIGAIIQVIKDILKLIFSIPPCDDGEEGDIEGCCTNDVCPRFIRENETLKRITGTLQYYPRVGSVSSSFPAPFNTLFVLDKRVQSHQFFDSSSDIYQQFINITDAADITSAFPQPKPVFFPTDVVFTAITPPGQAPYVVDLRLFYDPVQWGRKGPARYIKFTNCIVLLAPTRSLSNYNNDTEVISSGVLKLAGGIGREDNDAPLFGFADDGITEAKRKADQSDNLATLENFLFTKVITGADPKLFPSDGYKFNNVEYTFKIHHEVLLGKALITLGCLPIVKLNKNFVNTIFAGSAGAKLSALSDLVNGRNGNVFPDVNKCIDCLTVALDAFRHNISTVGTATFQATTIACLNKLTDDTHSAIKSVIGIGHDTNKSTFTLNPEVQFTGRPIKVSVQLNESSGVCITENLPSEVSGDIEKRIKGIFTAGTISNFAYDGYKFFEAEINSDVAAEGGLLQISFDNQLISDVNMPSNIDLPPTNVIRELPYSFIFVPTVITGGEGSADGAPRRDDSDLARDSKNNGS